MSLHLYNTLTRRVEPFVPLDPACPTMYLCGPTVYNYIHIGNARGPVVFGVLAALLRRRYGNLRYARNFTDVDDKINAAALEQKVPISAITDRFSAAYLEDLAALGVDGEFSPNLMPAATEHIPQMIAMIQRLIDEGHAYAAEGHVLFAVDTFAGYGKLSRRDPEDMIAGARVEVAPYKRNPGDFVLWKPSTDDLPGWKSPWSVGRPGWHIECSAMAEAHLGETIDIHAGGIDLQFPHHENEVAQSECAHGGRIFANWWLHNGMLNFGGSKMAKSVGNIQRVHDLVREHPPEALRYALLSAHYRQPLEWSDELIERSSKTLDRLYGALRDLPYLSKRNKKLRVPSKIEKHLNEDLNTPVVLSLLSNSARKIQIHLETLRSLEKEDPMNVDFFEKMLNSLDTMSSLTDSKSISPFPTASDRIIQTAANQLKACGFYNLQKFLTKSLKNNSEQNSLEKITCRSLAKYISNLRNERTLLVSSGLALGLLQQSPEAWFARGASNDDDARIQSLVDERNTSKAARDFARADAIRKQLADEGILLEDTPQGVRWKRA